MTIEYLEDYCIPGKDYSEDAFFMDTNYLIAFLTPSHSRHISSVIHTMYLIQQQAKLYINEIVLSEAIDVLARGTYTEEQYSKWRNSEEHTTWLSHHSASKQEYMKKKDEIRSTFIPNIVKNHENPHLLKYYNKKATEQLEGFLQSRLFRISTPNLSVLEVGMKFAKSVPLQSNDAFIAAAAASHSAILLTFDNDFKKVSITNPDTGQKVIPISLKMTNNYLSHSHSHKRMNDLDQNLNKVIEQAVGGHEEFIKKFGPL
jgi:predicted nucleic acid-binding protein